MVSGCGYTLNHRLKDEFKGTRGFFVPVFTNETEEQGVDITFTNALVRELESHGEELLTKGSYGGIEILGTISQVGQVIEAQSGGGNQGLQSYIRIPDQIGVTVRVSLVFREMATKKVLLNQMFSNYRRTSGPQNRTHDIDAPSSLPLMTESIVRLTYADIAREMMRDVYDRLVNF
jgi:hypothetical protein